MWIRDEERALRSETSIEASRASKILGESILIGLDDPDEIWFVSTELRGTGSSMKFGH